MSLVCKFVIGVYFVTFGNNFPSTLPELLPDSRGIKLVPSKHLIEVNSLSDLCNGLPNAARGKMGTIFLGGRCFVPGSYPQELVVCAPRDQTATKSFCSVH